MTSGKGFFQPTDEESERTLSGLATRVADLELKLDFAARASNAFAARVTALEQRINRMVTAPVKVTVEYPLSSAPFGSIDKLVEQAEQMFDCKNGDWRQYHTVYATDSVVEYEYVCLALIASADIPEAQEHLRQAVYTSLLKLKQTCKSRRPVLYWRYAVQERIQEEAQYDGDVPMQYKIRTRIAIPEADYSVVAAVVAPEGVPIAHIGP